MDVIFSQDWRCSKEANFNPFNSLTNAQAVVTAVRDAVQGMSKLFARKEWVTSLQISCLCPSMIYLSNIFVVWCNCFSSEELENVNERHSNLVCSMLCSLSLHISPLFSHFCSSSVKPPSGDFYCRLIFIRFWVVLKGQACIMHLHLWGIWLKESGWKWFAD